jgi:hypothetical protein
VSTCTARSDAATKGYVDDEIRFLGTRAFTVSIDITGRTDPNAFIISYLNALIPINNAAPYEYLNLLVDSRARVLCSNTQLKVDPQQYIDINENTVQVLDTNGDPQSVITTGVEGVLSTATIIRPIVTYTIRQFKVASTASGASWEFDSIVLGS